VEREKNEWKLGHSEVLVRQEGEALLFNVCNVEDSRTNYTFGRLVLNDNAVVAWWVRLDAIRLLADQSVIQATFKTNNNSVEAQVTGGFDHLAGKLAAPDGWLLLALDSPLTFLREKADP
jgi:hypothetical protein